jgi:hypothetical protein
MRARLAGIAMFGLVGVASAGHRGGGGHSSRASSGTGASHSSHAVSGYSTKRGTQVAAHRQSNSDGTQRNNWATKGNTNLSTGRAGTKAATH